MKSLNHGVYHVKKLKLDSSDEVLTQCSLVVNPRLGWAIATERPGHLKLDRYQELLASTVCEAFNIHPRALILFRRPYGAGQALSVVRLVGVPPAVAGARACFSDARTEQLTAEQQRAVHIGLDSPRGPGAEWRAWNTAEGKRYEPTPLTLLDEEQFGWELRTFGASSKPLRVRPYALSIDGRVLWAHEQGDRFTCVLGGTTTTFHGYKLAEDYLLQHQGSISNSYYDPYATGEKLLKRGVIGKVVAPITA